MYGTFHCLQMYLIYLGQVVSDTFFSVKKSQTLLWVSERIAISASRKIKSSFWTQNISLFPYELLPRLILTLLYIVTFWDELISEVLFLWVQITDCKLLKKSENMKTVDELVKCQTFSVTIFRFLHLSLLNNELLSQEIFSLFVRYYIKYFTSEWISTHCEWWGILKHAV